MNAKQLEQQQAIKELKALLKEGDTIFTVLKQVSGSGMYRHIQPIIIRNNEPLYLPWLVSKAINWPYKAKTHALGVSGCGMDMGFHLVHCLGHALKIKLNQRWL